MNFQEFSRSIETLNATNLSKAIATQIREYKKLYKGDINEKYRSFFAKIIADTESHSFDVKSIVYNYQSYYEIIQKGNSDKTFLKEIYYWFKYFCKDEYYAIGIEKEYIKLQEADLFKKKAETNLQQQDLR